MREMYIIKPVGKKFELMWFDKTLEGVEFDTLGECFEGLVKLSGKNKIYFIEVEKIK